VSQEDERMSTRLELFKEGLSTYLDALIAVKGFRQEIYRRTRKVLLDGKAAELGALLEMEIRDIKDYANPDGINNYDGSWAWIAERIISKDRLACYFGVYFNRDHAWVTVSISLTRKQKDFVMDKCQKMQTTVELIDDGYEISARCPIAPSEFELFEERLIARIDDWSRVWRHIGGIKMLPIV
jgi:hypothetical protein